MYMLQENFAFYIMNYPTLLQRIDMLSEKQKQQILISIDEEEILKRTRTYFENDAIFLQNHTLYYENTICQKMFQIRFDGNAIIIYDYEKNPFYPFLKRIYRKNIIYPQSL